MCLEAGAAGITVHPRADARHITRPTCATSRACSPPAAGTSNSTSKAIRAPTCWRWCYEVRPDQCTLVPVAPGEITSQAGWPADTPIDQLRDRVQQTAAGGVRVSLFVDPDERGRAVGGSAWAPIASSCTRSRLRAHSLQDPTPPHGALRSTPPPRRVATDSGLGMNAGHDLDLDNLVLFRTLPQLAEVSIGHALISHALFVGLDRAVRDYVAAVAGS